jgi:hypothetical protein
VGARDRPPRHDEVSLGNERLHLETNIGEGCSKALRDCLLAGRAWRGVAAAEVVTNVVVCNEFVGGVEVATIPELVVETEDQLLVGVERGVDHAWRQRTYPSFEPLLPMQRRSPQTGPLVSASLGPVVGSLCDSLASKRAPRLTL